MAEIATLHLDFAGRLERAWDDIAMAVVAWAETRSLALRDCIVLLPLAQHLPLARRAFASCGGWMPRVETVRTLAAACPPGAGQADGLSFDVAQDRLRAAQLLRSQAWARRWSRDDPRAFGDAVASVVDCAHRLSRAAQARPPALREAWFAEARRLLEAGAQGPGATERLLARVALEWLAASGELPGDALYGLKPAGWVVLRVGGHDPVAEAVMAAGSSAGLVLQADPQPDAALSLLSAPIAQAVCKDFEDEAQTTAAHLLALLQQGRQPLALVALDRVLVRRVAALLARQQVPLIDETGWKLSTTRAAAAVMALLRAASPVASTDDLLDWLKSLSRADGVPSPMAVQALESALRRSGCTRRTGMAGLHLEGAAAEVCDWCVQQVGSIADTPQQMHTEWSTALRATLESCGQWAALQADPAGRRVIEVLHLDGSGSPAWQALVSALPQRLADFTQAVDEALEQAVFEPPPPDAEPVVIITPLRRAVLRPFAAVVMPGADERRLGVPPSADALLGEALSVALGLPGVEQQQQDELLALAQVLRNPHALLLHRAQDESQLLGPSPLLERLALLRRRAGRPLQRVDRPGPQVDVEPLPVLRPQPVAAAALPASLSASAVEALRDCPYRFFTRSVLRLRDADELEDEVEKRDYGNWLHAVLMRFHQERGAPRTAADDLARLRALAQEQQAGDGLDPAAFLPFEASFERFAPSYVDWLQQRDAEGARWLEAEVAREVAAPEWLGIGLQGRIDRIDSVPGETGTMRQVIDYKTTPLSGLKKRTSDPLEDTQLAFYAALEWLNGADATRLQAAYLALDDSGGVTMVPHPEVVGSAERLLEGLASEFQRLREGAALPALGEGRVCDFCEARGLCRRDHWLDENPDDKPD
jgi:ATP-dependent helicase/nuclease subunit B